MACSKSDLALIACLDVPIFLQAFALASNTRRYFTRRACDRIGATLEASERRRAAEDRRAR